MYQWKKLFPLQGEERKSFLKPSGDLAVRSFFCPMSSGLCFCVFFFLQWSKRPKSNLSYKKQDSDDYKVSDQEQLSLLSLPRPIYVLHRRTKITGPPNTVGRITKIHSSESGGRQDGEVRAEMAQGESIQISPGMGPANARKELQKNLWSFQTYRCWKSILVGYQEDSAFYMHRRQKSGFLRENGVWAGLLAG